MALQPSPVAGRDDRFLGSRLFTPPRAYVLACDAGSYFVSGQDVSFRYWHLNVDSGTYSIVGAESLRAIELVGGSGTYNITGTDATLAKGLPIVADSGSYAITGTAAGLSVELNAAVGSYSLTGTDASLETGYQLDVDSGVYSLSGQDATLVHSGGAVTLHLLACLGAGT